MDEKETAKRAKPDTRILWLFFYFLCLYLAVNLMPFSWFIEDPNAVFGCQIGLKALLLAYFIWECSRKENRKLFVINRLTPSALLWIPLLLPCFSNLLYSSFFSGAFVVPEDGFRVVLLFIDDLVVALMEEIIFRGLLYFFFLDLFKSKKKGVVYAILLSSAVFACLHLVNIFSSDPLAVLLQMGYSFVLGLVLCAVYAGGENIILPIVGHFLFNAINDTLSSSFFVFKTDMPYLIWSLLFAVFGLLYATIVFIVMNKRKGNVS